MIVIVDDNRENGAMLARLLDRSGHPSVTLSCGPDLFTYLDSAPAPRLIILDIMMPEMDGLTCLERLGEHAAWRHVPVLIYSADVDHEYVLTARQLGARDYVIKGCVPWRDLLHTIRKHAVPAPADA